MMRKTALVSLVLAGTMAIAATVPLRDNLFEISKQLEIVTALFRELNIFYVDPLQPGEIMETGINAMLHNLDPYTTYYAESRVEDLRIITTGEYGGVGASVTLIQGEIVLTDVYEGFPAAEAGLRVGDVLVAVDGTELKDRDFESVMDHLQGASGSLLALTYRKPGSNALLELEVERVKVKRPAVSYRGMLDERTGIVRLDRFTRGASGEVRKAVKYLLDSSGADQIILDLRGNGGGLLHEAVHIVGHFVAQGELVVETRGKTAEWDKVYETMAPPIADSIPLAVLIDPVSASASEIVAGTLQDLDRALIVGEESFGKGLVQQNKDLAYGTKVKVTVAKYYTPSGRCIQRLDYSGERNPDGTAEAVPDSLRRTFTTRRGRIVVDGTGVQPDLYVTQTDLPEFLRALYQEQIPLAWLTQVYAIEDSLETADGFELSDMELGTCFRFIEKTAEEQAWSFGSELTDWLEDVGEIQVENEAAVAEAVATLKSELAPGTDALLLRHRARLKKELEGDVLFMLAPREEAISHWLAQDLVTLEASKALVDGRAETLLKAP